MRLAGKRALVMGLGVHGGGTGVARFLALQGADVTVTDLRGPDDLRASLDALAGLPIRFVLGEHREDDFRRAEIVVRNPAVPPSSRYLQVARAAGATIEMEMTIFFRLCPGPILGVTGTKGKTTTTLLLGAMLREQVPDTVIAGNLRISALEQLPAITATTPVVLELSSFVLEGLGEAGLSPKIACITTLAPDHLDRHGTMEAYIRAKEQIWRHQRSGDAVVLNADSSLMRAMAVVEQRPDDVVWFASAAHPTPTHARRAAFWQGDELIWRDHRGERYVICTRNDVQIRGAHNLGNIAAATAAACSLGVVPDHIRRAVHKFTGVEHRLELVRELDGVRYINDTAATTPEAAIAALHSFNAPIVLIAGGADKQLSFEDFAQEIATRAKAVVLLHGTATPKLQQTLHMAAPSVEVCGPFDDFTQAITTARHLTTPGDIVLLSPGCASFGMFRNEFHRGEAFRRIVESFT